MFVLLVDDDPSIRELIKESLAESFDSPTFIEANDSQEAIIFCEELGARLTHIICDFNMPGGNGDLLFSYWKKHLFHLPFVLLTSEVKTATEKFQSLGDIEYPLLSFIEKSGNTSSLIKEIKKLSSLSFFAISFNQVKSNQKLNASLFVSLNNKKLVKLFRKGDSVSKEKLQSLNEKGVKTVYVPREEGLSAGFNYPIFPLHNNDDKKLSTIMEGFVNLHESLLESLVKNPSSLKRSLHHTNQLINELIPKDKLFKWLMEKDVSQKDYVFHHSTLVIVLTLMGMEELRINLPAMRRSVMNACLFHDLFKTNSEALVSDLGPEQASKSGIKRKIILGQQFNQIESMAKDAGLNQDSIIILEALILGLHDPQYSPRGNHKLAHLALSFHRLSSELYRGHFLGKFNEEEILKFSPKDKQIRETIQKIF